MFIPLLVHICQSRCLTFSYTGWWLINVTVNADKNKINTRKSLNIPNYTRYKLYPVHTHDACRRVDDSHS